MTFGEKNEDGQSARQKFWGVDTFSRGVLEIVGC